jgi:hypothetical protein
MTVETDLFTALGPLVGSRVAPVIFPQPPAVPTWPAIRYTFVDSVPIVDICGDGDDQTAELRVQLDVVATTYKAARALRLQVMAAMRTFVPPAILELSLNDYDTDTKTYREILSYTIHGSSLDYIGSP